MIIQKQTASFKQQNFYILSKTNLLVFFCGGKACKHEDYHYNLNNNNAILGLHSNFITENVIASQRPSEVLIKD